MMNQNACNFSRVPELLCSIMHLFEGGNVQQMRNWFVSDIQVVKQL